MKLFPHDCLVFVVFLPCFFNNFLKKKLLDRISEARNMTHLTISFRKKKHKMTISSTEACVKHSSSERERKFRCRLCTSSVHREIRHFHVVVVQ